MNMDLRMGWEQEGLWDLSPWDGEGAEITFSTLGWAETPCLE